MDNNLNQNNTNQTNMNTGGMTPNPIPPVTPPAPEQPSPVPQAPVSPGMQESPVPAPPVTPSQPSVGPSSVVGDANGMQIGVTENVGITMPTPPPVENMSSQAVGNASGTINLQPEGVVEPIPEPTASTSSGVEPLMSTPLNETTNLNSRPNPYMDNNMNGMGMPTQDMGINPNNNPQPMGMNQVGAMPMNNSIDMMGVPTPPQIPSEENKKKKKGNNKILLIILIVVLIAGVGFGLYYVLVLSKQKTTTTAVTITPILTEVERGTSMEEIASNFATVTNYDINSCTVDTDLDTLTVGSYEYTVTCGTATASQTVAVTDTSAPFATAMDVIVAPGEEVAPEDFIYGIDEEISGCTFEFENPVDTSAEGTYQVQINISDAYENVSNITANLIVDANAPQSFLYCQDNADEVTSYRFGIDASGNLYNSKQIVTYSYEDEAAYNTAVQEYKNTNSLNNVTGIASFDSQSLQITLMQDIDTTELATAFNLSVFPTTDAEIETLFTNGCDIGFN